jgi:hypothetical protein
MNGRPYFVDLEKEGNTIVLKWVLKKSCAVYSLVKVTVNIWDSWRVEKLESWTNFRWHTRKGSADGNLDRLWWFRVWTPKSCFDVTVLCCVSGDLIHIGVFSCLNINLPVFMNPVIRTFTNCCSTAVYSHINQPNLAYYLSNRVSHYAVQLQYIPI